MFFLQFTLYQFDPLLQAMYSTPPEPRWNQSVSQEVEEQTSEYRNDNPEPEHLSWELGVPDNLPELEIVY